MKTPEALNMLAMLADADARATAHLVEMIAAATVMKLAPPQGEDVATVTISQADLNSVMRDHRFFAEYDSDGTMTLRLTAVGD